MVTNAFSQPIVSVIIAAYNAENYISRCLQSLVSQTLESIEILVINDGSADQTRQIVESFAIKDQRIHIYNQENQGVAAARQRGLDLATGIYTIHVDSDDWVDSEMLESLVNEAELCNADMVLCDFYFIHKGNIVEYRSQKPKSLIPMSLLGEMMFDLHGSLCNKLIRRSLFYKYNIRFINGMDLAEDQFVVLRLLAHNIKIAYLSKAFYHYDHTQNSSSICNSGVRAEDRLKPLELISSYTDISPIQEDFNRAIFHLAYEYLYEPKSLCPDYPGTFKRYYKSIMKVRGFPLYTKLLISLRIIGINIPLNTIKNTIKHLLSHASRAN